ncbi:MAG: hypothetical protein Q9218_005123 [Villophora microphyllina]
MVGRVMALRLQRIAKRGSMDSPAPIVGKERRGVMAECLAASVVWQVARRAISTTPSVTYAIALQSRLDACETLLNRLRVADDSERTLLLDQHFAEDQQNSKRKRSSIAGEQNEGSSSIELASESETADTLVEASVDDEGHPYGLTSMFHPQLDQSAKADVPGTVPVMSNGMMPWDSSLGLDTPSPSLSISAQTDISSYLHMDIGSQICNELLETYWCWPHHLHLVLCRKIFMRDLTNSEPYVTPFLLHAVLAQAARYSDRPEAAKLGQAFAQRTLDTLAAEVDKGSSIPTIQGLLIFSARECACGRTSQGWLYSGMAFRMMRDMGIHIPPRKLSHLGAQFTPAESALRQQIFWSCYTWDKTMSLCLGRAPAMHDVIPPPTSDIILDGEEAENEAWRPRFAALSTLEVGMVQKARTNSRFVAYCQLCMIIDEVLSTLYSKPHSAQSHLQNFLDRTIGKLESWSRGLPPHLYVREDSRSVSCPPLHILLLNLLYHATIILLCRPYRSKQQRAREMATTAAEMIDRLFMLHVRRFGFRVITYLESYTMFVASTINILDLKDGIEEEAAGARLALSLEVLRNASSTPSNARCVEIIQQLLRKNEHQRETRRLSQASQAPSRHPTIGAQQPLDHPRRQSWSAHSSMYQRTPIPQMPTTALTNSQHNGVAHLIDDYAYSNTPGTDSSTSHFFDQNTNLLSPDTLQMTNDFQVDTPMRWLADNMGGNPRPELWMMMDMDFSKEYSGALVPGQG